MKLIVNEFGSYSERLISFPKYSTTNWGITKVVDYISQRKKIDLLLRIKIKLKSIQQIR